MSGEIKCNEVEKSLYEFKEQYARNGKEILRLAMAIESITKEVRGHHKFSEENKKIREQEESEFKEQLKPLLDNYNAFLTGRKWVFGKYGLLVILSSIGGFYLIIRNIINK